MHRQVSRGRWRCGIMELAGGPGDRWLGHCKMAGREESPDTVLRHVGRSAFTRTREAEASRATVVERGEWMPAMVSGERSTELLTGRRA